MSVKRLNTFSHDIGDSKYELPKTPDSPFIVDDSNFIPMSEAVKQLGTTPFNGDTYKGYYDFQDGKDTGIEVPINRTKNGKDIAEISSAIMEKVDDISEELKKQKEFEKFKQETEERLNASKPSETAE